MLEQAGHRAGPHRRARCRRDAAEAANCRVPMRCAWRSPRRKRWRRDRAGQRWCLPPTRWWRAGGAFCPRRKTQRRWSAVLRLLSGRRHQVLTALALCAPGGKLRTRIVTTRVAFKKLTAQRNRRLCRKRRRARARPAAMPSRAARKRFVRFINGSYSNVVGLPLYETCRCWTVRTLTLGERR